MTGKDLWEGMGQVDERFLEEAEHRTMPRTTFAPWIKIAAMAACLGVILLGLYPLGPDRQGNMEGITGEGVYEHIPENNKASLSPEDGPVGEVPNTILYVEEMTADGFIATVTDLGVTQVLGLDTTWNVVIRDGIRHASAVTQDSATDYTGCYVLVQFYNFYPETGTIVAETVQIIEKG